MHLVCLDLEGVLVPEIWIAFAEATRIDELRLTTRDISDYDQLMKRRIAILRENGLRLGDIQAVIAGLSPLDGALTFLDSLREVTQVIILSDTFSEFAAPLMRRTFGGSGPAWSADNLVRLYTRVEPGFIRVDADEVTYPAHVILRYQLERAMIDGTLEVADLPAAWRDGMRELLGLEVPDHRRGCLQAIHWFDGAFGYFPTYTLGALTAAQLFAAATSSNADIRPAIARGDFAPLLAWLRENVHGKGALLDTDALIRQATGEPLGTAAFKAHLERRYLA